jgi:hypothetical protein
VAVGALVLDYEGEDFRATLDVIGITQLRLFGIGGL